MQYNIITSSYHAVHYILITYLFYKLKFVSFDHLYPFLHPLLLVIPNLFCVCVDFSFFKIIHTREII